MKKRIAVISVMTMVLSIIIFSQLSKNEIEDFSIILDRGAYISPDNKHEIILQLCLPKIDSLFGYVRGTLVEKNDYSQSSKIIYWDKVEVLSNGQIDVEWIDIENVKIESIEFNISKFPDMDIYNYNEK